MRAALDLFTEQGYENTAVTEIAERAGLTKSTFFRHFPDKREVLFAGQEVLSQLMADGIAQAPGTATPLEAVAAALDAVEVAFTPQRREFGPQLQAVIASNSELQERAALKQFRLATAMTTALLQRGVPDQTATIAAELGMLAFHRGYERWVDPAVEQSFGEVARQELKELQVAAATLD